MSNKNLTNNQLLLKEIISQEYEDNNQFASLDTFSVSYTHLTLPTIA